MWNRNLWFPQISFWLNYKFVVLGEVQDTAIFKDSNVYAIHLHSDITRQCRAGSSWDKPYVALILLSTLHTNKMSEITHRLVTQNSKVEDKNEGKK